VRVQGDAAARAPAIRNAIWSVDRNQPITRVTTMNDLVAASEADRHFVLMLFEAFALVGLVLAATGIYGVLAGSVTERTREIGLLKAIGARPRQILMQFLIEALVLTFIGGSLGILASWLLTVVIPPMPLYSEFYKTANHQGDIFLKASVGVMAVSFVILSLVGITSGFWPALKASRLEPIEALRYD
jgi:putative ABC transport system permease protein